MADLATLLAAAVRGNTAPSEVPPGYYMNENLPRQLPPPPPAAMLPPGFQMPQEPGVWEPKIFRSDPNARPVQTRQVPNFYRLNPGPRNNWRDMET